MRFIPIRFFLLMDFLALACVHFPRLFFPMGKDGGKTGKVYVLF